MPSLSNEGFLAALGGLFASTASKGSVWVTTKNAATTLSTAAEDLPRVLFRAKAGKRTIWTLVSADELPQFNAQYSLLLRASMSQLKKTSKAEKKKAAVVAGAAVA